MNNIRILLYTLTFAFLDIFPISIYGNNVWEKLKNLGYSFRAWLSTVLNILRGCLKRGEEV